MTRALKCVTVSSQRKGFLFLTQTHFQSPVHTCLNIHPTTHPPTQPSMKAHNYRCTSSVRPLPSSVVYQRQLCGDVECLEQKSTGTEEASKWACDEQHRDNRKINKIKSFSICAVGRLWRSCLQFPNRPL